MKRLLLLALLGCGDPALEPHIGAQCISSLDCENRQTSACIAIWPQGYCTEVDCSLGSCGATSACAAGLTFSGVSFSNFCLATCATLNDCRPGYTCVDIAQSKKVCVPENPR